MNIKLALYCLSIPLCIWVTTSMNLDKLFRKNRITQIHFFYVIVCLIMSYLLANFFMDLYNTIVLL